MIVYSHISRCYRVLRDIQSPCDPLTHRVPLNPRSVPLRLGEVIDMRTTVKLFMGFDADQSGTIDVVEYEAFVKYLVALVTQQGGAGLTLA